MNLYIDNAQTTTETKLQDKQEQLQNANKDI